MDLVLYHGKVYLQKEKFAEAVWIHDDLVAAVGSDVQILAMVPLGAQKMDVGGRVILPGFNDSHQHMSLVGEWQALCDLGEANGVEDIIARCRTFMKENPQLTGAGIHGIGWNQDYFTRGEQRPPIRQELDRISTEIPIVLERVCGHMSCANTKALEIAQITAQTVIDGGEIMLGEDGLPNGIVTENACYAVAKAVPKPDTGRLEELYCRAMRLAVRQGLTSVQSNDVGDENADWMFPLWRRLYEQGRLPLRYRHQYCFLQRKNFEHFLHTEWEQRKSYNRMLSLGPLKLYKDGSLGARTALMRQPYADDPLNYGTQVLSDDQMDELCNLAAEYGVQVVTHAIGDAAIAAVIDSYERTMQSGMNVLRHGLIHCQITDRALLERIARLGILAMVQPIFLNYDLHIAEARVGAQLASTSYAFASLKRLGAFVSLGTDAPVEAFQPFHNLYCAVERKDLRGEPIGGFYPMECMSLEDALDAYTWGSAHAEFAENWKGRLLPGYVADLIVLDRDIFTLPPEALLEVQVEMTMVGGRIVYQKID